MSEPIAATRAVPQLNVRRGYTVSSDRLYPVHWNRIAAASPWAGRHSMKRAGSDRAGAGGSVGRWAGAADCLPHTRYHDHPDDRGVCQLLTARAPALGSRRRCACRTERTGFILICTCPHRSLHPCWLIQPCARRSRVTTVPASWSRCPSVEISAVAVDGWLMLSAG